MENLDIYFKKVEEVLKTFPEECQRNYYQNKQTIKIEYKEKTIKHLKGTYDNKKNIITIYDKESIYHELFHMAFRDKNKDGKTLEGLPVYYGNGVSYIHLYPDKQKIKAIGLTEGFVEYLTRKIQTKQESSLEFYFINLLISIYSENLINYALLNDPFGLLFNKKIYNILEIKEKLDDIHDLKQTILTINGTREILDKLINEGTEEEKTELFQILSELRIEFKQTIIRLFELFISSYKKCHNPKIDKLDFIELINCFINDPSYQIAFAFDDEKYSVKEELTKLISKLEKNKIRKLIRKKLVSHVTNFRLLTNR